MNSAENLRFGRDRRLVRSAEFARVRAEGRAQRGSLIVLGILETSDNQPFRAGFVTSKRIGSAVVRNRVRRRLREIVRKHQHTIRGGIWLVVVARPAAARASYRTLEDEWLRLATRTSILPPACS
ncbi:MAG: ribonuclease P protein component [Chthoniobacterales bacterium]